MLVEKDRGAFRATHDQPIIIDGLNSIALEFDDDDDEHYVPDNPGDPTQYTGAGLRISSVTVLVTGQPPHHCPVPPSGRCTVVIQGRGAAGRDNPIEVDGRTAGTIVITPDRAYGKVNTGTNRKKHHAGGHRVRSLTIQVATGGSPHQCPAIPPNGKCRIRINDDHV
jgi:hypothetical protein